MLLRPSSRIAPTRSPLHGEIDQERAEEEQRAGVHIPSVPSADDQVDAKLEEISWACWYVPTTTHCCSNHPCKLVMSLTSLILRILKLRLRADRAVSISRPCGDQKAIFSVIGTLYLNPMFCERHSLNIIPLNSESPSFYSAPSRLGTPLEYMVGHSMCSGGASHFVSCQVISI